MAHSKCIIGAARILLIMASDKDRVDIISEWETIIDVGDSWYYYVALKNHL